MLLLSPPGDAFSFRRSGQECFSWSVLIGCVPAEHEGKFLETHLLDFPGGTKKSSIIFQGASIYFLLLIIFFGLLFIGIKSLVPDSWRFYCLPSFYHNMLCGIYSETWGDLKENKKQRWTFFAVRILRGCWLRISFRQIRNIIAKYTMYHISITQGGQNR